MHPNVVKDLERLYASGNYSTKSYKTWNDFDWNNASKDTILSEEFIRYFFDSLNRTTLTCYIKLSESFIRDYSHKLNWMYISHYQHLSEDFVREFKDKVSWGNIICKQNFSDEFLLEMSKYTRAAIVNFPENYSKMVCFIWRIRAPSLDENFILDGRKFIVVEISEDGKELYIDDWR